MPSGQSDIIVAKLPLNDNRVFKCSLTGFKMCEAAKNLSFSSHFGRNVTLEAHDAYREDQVMGTWSSREEK